MSASVDKSILPCKIEEACTQKNNTTLLPVFRLHMANERATLRRSLKNVPGILNLQS